MPSRKGPKIRELAEHLGLPPHHLLDRCREAGMAMQNTISRLTARQAAEVCAWFPDSPAWKPDDAEPDAAEPEPEPDNG